MPFRYCKHSLPLLLLLILLTSHSAHPVSTRRQLKDAKSILTSPGLLGTKSFFDVLRDSLFPSSSNFSNLRDENGNSVRPYTRKPRNPKSVAGSYRQSESDENFVIFASSPGRSGLKFTNVATQNNESEDQKAESNDNVPSPSIELEPVIIEGSGSMPSGSDLIVSSTENDNANDTDSNSSPASNGPPIPEADVFLNVSIDPGSSRNNSSTTAPGPQPTSDEPIDVEISVIGPSTEELLEFEPASASPEDNGDGSILFEISTGGIPEPSKTPDPQEDSGIIMVPSDTDVVFNSPDVDVDVDFPDISSDPTSTQSFESPSTAEATPQSSSLQPEVSANEPSVEQERESAVSTIETSDMEPSSEPNVLVDFPLSFSSSRGSLGPEFDRHSREFLGETTNTTADRWKPTEVSGTIRTVQRQQGSRWEITYQGELAEATVERSVETLERNINEGAMDTFLTDRLSTPVTVRTASPPFLNAPPRKEVPVTGPVLKETASGDPKTDSEEESEKSLGVILGTCFGLLGALVLSAAAFVVVRRSSRNDESHVLDGVATAPTTIMSFESDRTEGESRFHTGAPTKPRGPNVLRNQSRILDWQMDHATATGKAKHILGRENSSNDPATQVDSISDEGDVSTAEVLV